MIVPALSVLLYGAVAWAGALPPLQAGFHDAIIDKVEADLLQIATHSWELGTACEALTELRTPRLSVFSSLFPPPRTRIPLIVGNTAAMINISTTVVRNKPNGSLTLIDGDGAVGDPASLGVAVLLTNWTHQDLSDTSFAVAATEQLTFLTDDAPRTPDGAISHRQDQVQLWADFVYMAPPFIAYYGALQNNATLLQLAYDQCRLYRNYLQDDGGLWRHITLGSSNDTRHWGTGNAWAAAGMFRVLETIAHSSFHKQFTGQRANLTSWIHEIIDASWKFQQRNGTLLNVIDDETTFADSSSTALLAAVTFRYAVLTGDLTLIPAASRALNVIRESVDEGGWLHQTVDPETFDTPAAPGQFSPEGQAFVLLLHSAWRDFVYWATTTFPH